MIKPPQIWYRGQFVCKNLPQNWYPALERGENPPHNRVRLLANSRWVVHPRACCCAGRTRWRWLLLRRRPDQRRHFLAKVWRVAPGRCGSRYAGRPDLSGTQSPRMSVEMVAASSESRKTREVRSNRSTLADSMIGGNVRARRA